MSNDASICSAVMHRGGASLMMFPFLEIAVSPREAGWIATPPGERRPPGYDGSARRRGGRGGRDNEG